MVCSGKRWEDVASGKTLILSRNYSLMQFGIHLRGHFNVYRMLLDRCCRLQRPIHNLLRQTRTVLRRSMQAQQCCIGMVSKKWLAILGVTLT